MKNQFRGQNNEKPSSITKRITFSRKNVVLGSHKLKFKASNFMKDDSQDGVSQSRSIFAGKSGSRRPQDALRRPRMLPSILKTFPSCFQDPPNALRPPRRPKSPATRIQDGSQRHLGSIWEVLDIKKHLGAAPESPRPRFWCRWTSILEASILDRILRPKIFQK